jgi:hypothetical protein
MNHNAIQIKLLYNVDWFVEVADFSPAAACVFIVKIV